jgi:SAM-dependent methyltransferase
MNKKKLNKIIRMLLDRPTFNDYLKFKKALKDSDQLGIKRFSFSILDINPQIKDKAPTTSFDKHYVYHTSWAARILAETKPKKHIDISSSLYFSGIISAFIPIDFYDYRPANINLSNLNSKEGNLMSLPFADNSVQSISCMHTVEHVGLGRYGDPIDPDGDIKAINELKRVTARNGSLLFVVPMGGTPKIEFNAHRIYSYEQIMSYFKGFDLKEFALIPEFDKNGGLIRNADPSLLKGERYACGCFWFIKQP